MRISRAGTVQYSFLVAELASVLSCSSSQVRNDKRDCGDLNTVIDQRHHSKAQWPHGGLEGEARDTERRGHEQHHNRYEVEQEEGVHVPELTVPVHNAAAHEPEKKRDDGRQEAEHRKRETSQERGQLLS